MTVGPYSGLCENCEEPIEDLVFEDYDDEGSVMCDEYDSGFEDGVRILIDDETGTFSYAPIADPDISDLEARFGAS